MTFSEVIRHVMEVLKPRRLQIIYKINRIYNMHSPVHFEYPEICYPEEISEVPKVPDNQGLTVKAERFMTIVYP